MRRVRRASGIVDEKWLIARHSIMLMQPVNRFVGNVGGEVITLFRSLVGLDRSLIAIDARVVLVVGGLKESVEVLEAEACRPAIEGALWTNLPGRRVMPLAKGCRAVAVLLENFGNRRRARIRRRPLGNGAKANFMIVAPGQESGARR